MSGKDMSPVQTSYISKMDISSQAEFLSSILESSTEYSIIAKDLDGTILAWNEGAKRIYGYEPEEVVGKAKAFILHEPEDVKSGKAQKLLDEALAKGKWAGELGRIRKDGTKFTAFVTITLRSDQQGKPIGYTMISRDLTESQQLLAKLNESQEYNRGLIESNIDALMTTDTLGIINDVNLQMCKMTGCSKEELIGTPFKNYFVDPKRAEDGIRAVLTNDRVTNYELVMRSRTGKETIVSYNATTFKGSEGKLRGVFAAARDITEQKKLELDLRQAQNYTRSLIEASFDSLLTVDPEFKITDVNEHTIRTTGYTRDELIGSDFPDYFTDSKRATEGVQKTLHDGFVTNYVLTLRSKDKHETLVSFNASVFKDMDGMVLGIFASARDITEQMSLEEKLREAQNYTRGLIESSVDAMITVDPELVITDVNEQMVRLTEVSKNSLIGSRFDQYFTDPKSAVVGVRKTLSEGSVNNYELILRTQSGQEVLVSFNASIFKDQAGNVRGIFASARDVTEQRRLENQLQEQQNYSRGLIEASVDALVTVNPEGNITDVNEQMLKLTGEHQKNIIGSPFSRYFTEPERASIGVNKTFDEGFVKNYELVIRSKSSTETLVSFNAAIFRDTAGKVAGIFAAARDITDQKKLESELRDQQVYSRGLIESNIDALMTTDPIGVITDVNKQMCAITGLERDQLIGTPFKNYFVDQELAEEGIRKVLSENRVTNYELTIKNKNGDETVVSYNATTFKGADGKLKGVFAAARDITVQKDLEEKIKKQNKELTETGSFLNNILESSTGYSIIASDLDGGILAWNEGAHRNYGYTAAEMVLKKNVMILYTPEDITSGKVKKFLDAARSAGRAEEVFERVRKAGDRFTAAAALTLRQDSEGKPIGYVLISKDITEQKLLEEQLHFKNEELKQQNQRVLEATRLKSEFLANMSHELRTPLNAIIGFTKLMHSGTVGPVSPDHKEYLGDILKSSEHLLQLINDVLDLAKVESGKMEFHPEPVNLDKLINESTDILRTLIAKNKIHLSINVDKSLTNVVIDPSKFKQVLYNYVSNAIKFTPEGGQVNISADIEDPENFRLSVKDSGIGIKEEDLSRLFIEFQQLDSSIAKKYQGTGLGLALTRHIVESQGGTVGLTSTFGQGSVFYAVLPRIQSAMTVTQEHLPDATVHSEHINIDDASSKIDNNSNIKKSVLVVNDDSASLKLAKRALETAGYTAICCSDAESGLQIFQEKRPNAVILDLLMPEIDGFEFLQRLRLTEAGRHTPVIIWTVKDLSDAERIGLNSSAQAIVQKISGFSTDDLIVELNHVIRSDKNTDV